MAKPTSKTVSKKGLMPKVLGKLKELMPAGKPAPKKALPAKKAAAPAPAPAKKTRPVSPTAAKPAVKAPARSLKTTSVTNDSVESAKQALSREKGAKETPTIKPVTREKAAAKPAVTDEKVAATGPLAQKWTALYKKAGAIESKPYNMRQTYTEKTAIVHKHLGWGYILANRNDRLEVLFKDGIKYLISNYK